MLHRVALHACNVAPRATCRMPSIYNGIACNVARVAWHAVVPLAPFRGPGLTAAATAAAQLKRGGGEIHADDGVDFLRECAGETFAMLPLLAHHTEESR